MQRATGQCRLDLADQLRADGACELQVKQLLGGRIPHPSRRATSGRAHARSANSAKARPRHPCQRFPGRTRPRPGRPRASPDRGRWGVALGGRRRAGCPGRGPGRRRGDVADRARLHPPEHRGHGYAAAVTAAAARWALGAAPGRCCLRNPVIGLPLQRGARAPSGGIRGARPASSTTPSGPSPDNQEGRRRTPVDQVEHAAQQYAARWSRIAGVDLWLSQPVSSGEDPPIRGEAGT